MHLLLECLFLALKSELFNKALKKQNQIKECRLTHICNPKEALEVLTLYIALRNQEISWQV